MQGPGPEAELSTLRHENNTLKDENSALKQEIASLKAKIVDLRDGQKTHSSFDLLQVDEAQIQVMAERRSFSFCWVYAHDLVVCRIRLRS